MALKASLFKKWESEFEKGTSLAKCRRCGCMIGALEELKTTLSSAADKKSAELIIKVGSWLSKMESSLYT